MGLIFGILFVYDHWIVSFNLTRVIFPIIFQYKLPAAWECANEAIIGECVTV